MILIFISFILNLFTPADDIELVRETYIDGFQNAVSVTTDAKDNIYVLDAGSNQIVKYDKDLIYLKRNGKQGWADGQFDSPTFIDGSSGLDIFVSDGKNRRVQRLDLELSFISSLKTNLPDFAENLQFNTPVGTLIMNSSELYVLDGDNHRIIVYKDGRNPSNVFGDYKSGKGELLRPIKIMKDSKNFVYVFDKELKSIIRFDNLGNYVSRLAIDKLETFTIRDNVLYMFNGKDITLYDLDKNQITGKRKISDKDRKKKFTDLIALGNEKYLLLNKNALSLFVIK